MADTATIAFGELVRFARFVESHYRSPKAHALLHQATGLTLPDADSEESQLERRVSMDCAFDLWAAAGRAVQDPALPIEFASRTRAEDFGVVGLLAMTSASAEEALTRVFRYQWLVANSGRWTMHSQGDRIVLRWERAGEMTLGRRLADETVLAELLGPARAMLGELTPLEVRFRHAAPADTRAHRRFFRAPLVWGAEVPEIHLPLASLRAVPTGAHPSVSTWFLAEAERRLALAPDATMTSRVRGVLDAAMADGEPTLGRLAKQLAMSERSMRRHLTLEGVSFRHVLEDHRKVRARELLTQGHKPADIAFVLGFSEQSAFARAYRRWFGCAPTRDSIIDRRPTR